MYGSVNTVFILVSVCPTLFSFCFGYLFAKKLLNKLLYLAPILLSLWFKATRNYITYYTLYSSAAVIRNSLTNNRYILYGNWMCFFNVIDTYYTWEKRELTCHRKLSNRMKWNQLIKTYIRTEQNRTNIISNVYIVHSVQHWHIQHITHVIKAEKKKEKSRKKSCNKSIWRVEVIL